METEVWTIAKILDWTVGYLTRKGDEHPRLSAEWLLSNACGLTRVEIYMNFERPLVAEELDRMRAGVRRRGAGEPLQYVTGEMPFRHIVLRCERGVLIPRPETEILVEAALEGVDAAIARGDIYADAERRALAREEAERKESSDGNEGADADQEEAQEGARETLAAGPRVLEVGCGTGCIALSIASERPGTSVWATDLSKDAVRLCMRNRDALRLGDYVSVVECDLATGVDKDLMGTFSVLVSNPPYIPSAVVPTLPFEVQGFEPGLALDGGDDGLDVFRRLLALAPRALSPGGMLCVELFEENVYTALDLVLEEEGWAHAEVREDLTRRPRVLVAVREGA